MMDADRWQRIDALLAAALERAPDDRPAFLAAACAGEETLRAEVEELLAADGQARDFLETPAAEAVAGPRPPEEGMSLGSYRLEREIGCGGMGTVYEAVRADDAYRRRVAVKLLNPGVRSPSLVRRFHSERQILANLDHPSIARLFDGGTAPDGRPYQVMELIDGEPIDEFCDRRRLTVRRRLELFRRVCSAVQYAHQNLVVHRDIKPSNILVTDAGEPKLLDFGIAKLLAPESFPNTVEATVAGLHPMTPHYASPEQIRGEVITTASDVYSLGVLLYQLLTGRLPHRLSGLAPGAVDRVLSGTEPERPSTAVLVAEEPAKGSTDPVAEPEAVSRARGTRPRELSRRLAGDLDNIVLQALRKEPSRRYGSAAQLAEDLRRHMVGLPVVAAHDTWGYRMGKFLRRHRLGVAVAALFLFLVVAFAAAMARQATQTARQRDRAEVERAKAEQVSRFLVDLFKEVDPIKARGGNITTREVLKRGAGKVDRELGGQPEVGSRLLAAIGTVYLHLELYDEAAPLLEKALETRRAIHGDEHIVVAESLDRLGFLLLKQGRLQEAEPLLEKALEVREELLAPDHADLAMSLRNLAMLYRNRGEYDRAEPIGRRALETFRRALGQDHPEVALSLRVLAGVHIQRGEIDAAEALIEEALTIDEVAFGELHSATAGNLHNLGVLRLEHGRHAEAEALFRRSHAIWEQLLEEGHPRIGDALVSLGRISRLQGRIADAEAFFRRGLAVYRQSLAEEHPAVANCLYELGDVLAEQGHLREAAPLLVSSLEIREKLLGSDHWGVGESLRGLADLRRVQGRLDEAEQLFRRAYAIWELYPRTEGTARIPGAYAALLRARGREAEARALEERAEEHR